MSEYLLDLSTASLITAISSNLFEYYRYLGRSPQAEFYESQHLSWLLSGIHHPFVNAIIRTQLTSDNVDDLIEETLIHFRSKNMTRLSWWIAPGSEPADLSEHLFAHGLVYTEGGAGMAADLSALNEDMTTPPDFTVERVKAGNDLHKWVHAFITGFEILGSERATFNLLAGLGFDLPLRSYVGLLRDEPVAAAQLFLGAGVAGIYCVTTVPGVQRRGIGAAMVLSALREARQVGYHGAILHSTPMGYGVYRRLGFQELCRMGHFFWKDSNLSMTYAPTRLLPFPRTW
jgi:GNAT superfamily N-acetyltransferase